MDLDRLFVWVEPWIVPGFVCPPPDEDAAVNLFAAAGRSGADHARFLQRWNGCYALNNNLHVFGARDAPPNQSLDQWNRADGWRQSFGVGLEGIFFFAESGFGDQFGYRKDGKVVSLHAFEGRLERIASGFAEWLEFVFLEPARYLHAELFESCVQAQGPLPFGGHFVPDPQTFESTGTVDPRRVSVMPSRDSMELKGASSMTRVSRVVRATPKPDPRRR